MKVSTVEATKHAENIKIFCAENIKCKNSLMVNVQCIQFSDI